MSETLCKCGAMRMLNPSVSCARGNWIHAVSKCESTCDECASLRAKLSAAEAESSRLAREIEEARAEVATLRDQRDELIEANWMANRRAEAAVAVLREVETGIYWNDDPKRGMVSGWWRHGTDTAALHRRMLALLASSSPLPENGTSAPATTPPDHATKEE